MMQHIGQDFAKPITLHLLPHLELPNSPSTIHIQYMRRQIDGSWVMDHTTVDIAWRQDLTFTFGSDVYAITCIIETPSVWSGIHFNYRYHMRIDQLILLNLASQLLK